MSGNASPALPGNTLAVSGDAQQAGLDPGHARWELEPGEWLESCEVVTSPRWCPECQRKCQVAWKGSQAFVTVFAAEEKVIRLRDQEEGRAAHHKGPPLGGHGGL